jgi:RNA polymerase sigma factor (TIGR02999 family)
MNEVTQILQALERGDRQATDRLLPMVYDELRQLAAARLGHESPGQTLSATALVHEAYVRLVGGHSDQHWNSQGHFFAAAAVAMRRILIENARRKRRVKYGGHLRRIDLDSGAAVGNDEWDRLLELDQALIEFEAEDPTAYRLVQLRYFAGLSIQQAADLLSISVRTANRHWAYAKAWLYDRLNSHLGEE